MTAPLILVVDDNPTNLKLIKVILKVEGYEVACAKDADEVFTTLERIHPKLILMDIQLPGMDGLEITKRIKMNPAYKDILVIALSAYAMKGDEEKAFKAGCNGYITKPIDTQKLPDMIKKHLAQHTEKPRR